MVRFLGKGPLRLSGLGDVGGDTTAGLGEDGNGEAGDGALEEIGWNVDPGCGVENATGAT